MSLTSDPFASSSDLWLWPGADSRPRAWPHRLLDRVRGHALVPGSRDHAQLKGKCVRSWCGFCVGLDGFFVYWLCAPRVCLCLRATPSPLTSGQWAASWLRCCPTSPSSPGNTTWTSSITYWVRQSFHLFLQNVNTMKLSEALLSSIFICKAIIHVGIDSDFLVFFLSLCLLSYPLNYNQFKQHVQITFTVFFTQVPQLFEHLTCKVSVVQKQQSNRSAMFELKMGRATRI